jgi:agmatinase
MTMSHGFDPDAPAAGDGIFGLPYAPDDAEVVLLPVPWEATVSYRAGTANGPQAVLAASAQVDLFDRETGRPYERGIAMLPVSDALREKCTEARALAEHVIAAGGVEHDGSVAGIAAQVDALCEEMNAWVYRTAGEWLDRGKLVGVVGGDHSSPFGLIRAVAERHPGVGILHLDAHADLREAYEGFTWSHASIMFNVVRRIPQVARLVQVGLRDFAEREDALIRENPDRIRAFFEADLRRRMQDGATWSALVDEMIAPLPKEVYLSFDIDGLDPALCPHTGTPVPGGLSFAEAVSLVRKVAESGRRVVGFDLSEVAPDPESKSEWDGNVGARLLYKMIGFALKTR